MSDLIEDSHNDTILNNSDLPPLPDIENFPDILPFDDFPDRSLPFPESNAEKIQELLSIRALGLNELSNAISCTQFPFNDPIQNHITNHRKKQKHNQFNPNKSSSMSRPITISEQTLKRSIISAAALAPYDHTLSLSKYDNYADFIPRGDPLCTFQPRKKDITLKKRSKSPSSISRKEYQDIISNNRSRISVFASYFEKNGYEGPIDNNEVVTKLDIKRNQYRKQVEDHIQQMEKRIEEISSTNSINQSDQTNQINQNDQNNHNGLNYEDRELDYKFFRNNSKNYNIHEYTDENTPPHLNNGLLKMISLTNEQKQRKNELLREIQLEIKQLQAEIDESHSKLENQEEKMRESESKLPNLQNEVSELKLELQKMQQEVDQESKEIEEDKEKYFSLINQLSFYQEEKMKLKQELSRYNQKIQRLEREEIRIQFEKTLKPSSGDIEQIETTICQKLDINRKQKKNDTINENNNSLFNNSTQIPYHFMGPHVFVPNSESPN